jgi:DNA-binding NarL/FixJ family response regulator
VTLEQGSRLSPLEIVIADLAAHGRENEEIARELGIETRTVARHLTHVKRRLGLEPSEQLADQTESEERGS